MSKLGKKLIASAKEGIQIAKGTAPEGYKFYKSHCKFGHEYTAENTLWHAGGNAKTPTRKCRTCKLERAKKANRLIRKSARYERYLRLKAEFEPN